MRSLIFLVVILLCSCSDNSIYNDQRWAESTTMYQLTEDCHQTCEITFYPNDLENSVLPCGGLTVTYDDGYFIICLAEHLQITEFLGWHPNSEDEDYNKFLSLVIRDNCILFQPFDDFYTTVMEEGFQLDLVVCREFPHEIIEGHF